MSELIFEGGVLEPVNSLEVPVLPADSLRVNSTME